MDMQWLATVQWTCKEYEVLGGVYTIKT